MKVAEKVEIKSKNSTKYWATGKVLRIFFMDNTNQGRCQKVLEIAKQWEKYANLKLVEVFQQSESDIRISFDPSLGSWSYIGTESKAVHISQATMNFGWFISENNPDNKEYECTTLHEFGHALGFQHELQNPYY